MTEEQKHINKNNIVNNLKLNRYTVKHKNSSEFYVIGADPQLIKIDTRPIINCDAFYCRIISTEKSHFFWESEVSITELESFINNNFPKTKREVKRKQRIINKKIAKLNLKYYTVSQPNKSISSFFINGPDSQSISVDANLTCTFHGIGGSSFCWLSHVSLNELENFVNKFFSKSIEEINIKYDSIWAAMTS